MNETSGQILLHRKVNAVQPALLYRVEVDDQPIARLAISQRHIVDVSPGRHNVQAKVLWMSSRAVAVDVAPGQSVHIDIKPDVRHLWNMALRPSRFLRVEAVRDQ